MGIETTFSLLVLLSWSFHIKLPQHKIEDILKNERIIIHEEVYSLVTKSYSYYNFKIWEECY